MLKIFLKTNLTLLLCLMATSVWAQNIIYVKPATAGTGDGSSWSNATTLQAAIDVAGATDQIWVAQGSYLPTHNPGTTARDVTFLINEKKIELYGGFEGTTQNSLSQRNFSLYTSILSGNLNGTNVNNAHHVLTAIKAGGTIIDGFTITNPSSTYTTSVSGSITINGESLPRNNAGGFFIKGLDNDVSIKNCVFQDNRNRGEGGAIKVENGSALTILDYPLCIMI